MNSAERRYIWRVKNLNCVCCGAHGPCDAHHLRTGTGMSQKASHYLTIAFCKECHNMFHNGDRALMKIQKREELDYLALTIEQLTKEG